jgi:hypothetical protein
MNKNKPLSVTFSEVIRPDSRRNCDKVCCLSNEKPVKATHRWLWRGGDDMQVRQWFYVCRPCHVDLLGIELDDAKSEL